MSRVGKYPVAVPAGVEVSLVKGVFTAKGKNGVQTVNILKDVSVDIADNEVKVTPDNMLKRSRQAWGTTRALINNAIIGATDGFMKKLDVNGVGYRASVQGSSLKMSLGFSHEVDFAIPEGITIGVEGERGKIVLAVSGASKQRVGQVAAEIRAYRKPEPYKGKGIKYVDEIIVRKEGKKK